MVAALGRPRGHKEVGWIKQESPAQAGLRGEAGGSGEGKPHKASGMVWGWVLMDEREFDG